MLSNCFNQTFVASKVRTRFPEVAEQEICQVDVEQSSQPLVLETKDKQGQSVEKLYVRSGNSSQEIPLSEAHGFFKTKF